MTKELKCPKCGSMRIVKYDCYDTVSGRFNTLKELWCGHCKDCGTDIQWSLVYQFIGYDEIEAV